jgi:hypothetical protein
VTRTCTIEITLENQSALTAPQNDTRRRAQVARGMRRSASRPRNTAGSFIAVWLCRACGDERVTVLQAQARPQHTQMSCCEYRGELSAVGNYADPHTMPLNSMRSEAFASLRPR